MPRGQFYKKFTTDTQGRVNLQGIYRCKSLITNAPVANFKDYTTVIYRCSKIL